MRFIIRSLVGMIVLYILLAAFMLDPANALFIIAISMICTAGLSLVIWVPLAYVTGWGMLALIGWVTGVRLDGPPPSGPPTGPEQPDQPQRTDLGALSQQLDRQLERESALTNDQRAISTYIGKALERGLSREKIAANLQDNGWPTDSIKWGFDFVAGQSI